MAEASKEGEAPSPPPVDPNAPPPLVARRDSEIERDRLANASRVCSQHNIPSDP